MKRKQLYGRFKRLISNISNKKIWTWLRKRNFKRETESLLIAAQNTIRTNHIKARIEKTQRDSKCRLCADRAETINHIIIECTKLALKEYNTRHNWVGKVIYWELCKKLKFVYTNKWYIHSSAAVLANETHKLLWDFNIHSDDLISARRLDIIIITPRPQKKNLHNCGFCCSSWPQSKIERKWKEWQIPPPCKGMKKKLWNMKVKWIPIIIGTLGTVTEWLLKGQEDLEKKGRVETIQTTTLLRSAWILRRALETWVDLLSLKLQWKTKI